MGDERAGGQHSQKLLGEVDLWPRTRQIWPVQVLSVHVFGDDIKINSTLRFNIAFSTPSFLYGL